MNVLVIFSKHDTMWYRHNNNNNNNNVRVALKSQSDAKPRHDSTGTQHTCVSVTDAVHRSTVTGLEPTELQIRLA
jgi:outer membrane receptor for Fe3+-dicitrate